MKKLYIFLVLCIAAVTLKAQPQGYYNGTEGLTGDALKAALHDIIKNDDHVTYSGMWNAYQQTDKRPGTNYVWDIYSDVPDGTPPYYFTFISDQCGTYEYEGDCYNREHLWAQSWTNNDGTEKTDLHHVYPTDGFVNGKRDNFAFGEVGYASWTSQNGSKLGSCVTPGYNGTVFEPIDEYKGDIARALMYVSVRYYQEDGNWDNSAMTTKSVIKDWAMTMLLRWHEEDPVSQKEINRNNAVYSKQNNRNPFVDNPDFAEMIWDPNWHGDDTYQIFVAANHEDWGTAFIGDGPVVPSEPQSIDIDFSQQNYSNEQSLNDVNIALDENVSVVFNKGTGSNVPKYFNNGSSVRCYSGNNFVVSTTTGTITSITLTYGSGDGSNPITCDVGTFTTNTWTGDEASVTFSVGGTSGNRRIHAMTVTYSSESGQPNSYAYGSTVTITAVPNEGFYFLNWTKDNEIVSIDSIYTFTVTEDASFVANFKMIEDYIEFADSNVKEICVDNWDTNGSDELSYDEAAAVTSLGNVFNNNSTITSFDELQYFTGLTEIDDYAFQGTSLTSIIIPSSVTYIGDYAFSACTSLPSLTIPETVNLIGFSAFSYCSSLAALTLLPETPPSMVCYEGYSNFTGINPEVVVYVPCATSSSYSMASGWNELTNYQEEGCPYFEITVAANPEEYGEAFIGNGPLTDVPQSAYIDFSQEGYTNTQDLDGVTINLDDNVNVVFNKGTGSTTPKYYSSGSSVRCYGGNNFVVSTATGSITSITLTYSSGGGSNAITTDVATFNGTTWMGDATSVTFTVGGTSNHRRIKAIDVTYSTESAPEQQGIFVYGSTVVITAIPNEGYSFFNWTKDNEVISTDATYSFTVTEDATYIANFGEPENYIEFADANVEAICVANWDTNGSGKLSYEEAAAVTSLGTVFKNNTEITSFDELQYFTGLTAISNYAFNGCSNLITIEFPITVTTIDNAAVAYCTSLTSIEIPSSVSYIGPGAFGACSSLSQIIVEEGNTVYDSRDDSNAIIQTATNEILFGCKNTVIPNSVTSIGDSAFGYCTGLNTIEIPSSVISIGQNAFYNCTGLTEVVLGDSVANIDEQAFANCVNLMSITSLNADIPPYIGDMAFYNVPSTATVYVPCGTYYSYWNYPGWDYFSNFEEINCGTQAIALTTGWNWISFNVDITLDDLKAALVEALPGTNIMIKGKDNTTLYNPSNNRWIGRLNSLDVTQMYEIQTTMDGEIVLEGLPINPLENAITIKNGANWIAFPLSESMTLTDAFAGFAVEGDIVKSKDGTATYTRGRWMGTKLTILEPGKGYIYKSVVEEDRSLTFPMTGN